MTEQKSEDASRRVLILAPFGRDAALLARVLDRAGIPSDRFVDVAGLCSAASSGAGAVLIADEALTPEGMRLLTACLERQEPWSDLPIFVMLHQNELEGRIRLKYLEPLGNVTILERPLRGETLVSAFRMGLRAREHQYQLRARLEAEREAIAALRESERRYRTLAEAMPQLVWTCRADGACDYLSRQWSEYTGAPESEQLGFGWLAAIHPDDSETTNQAWRAAYLTGAVYDIEYRLRRHDGEYRWFKTRGVPVRDSDGEIQRWFGSCTDIEDQKRISEDRRELLAREQKARSLAELLNRVGPMLLKELDSGTLAQKVTDLATQLTGAQFGAFLQSVNRENGAATYAPFALSGAPPDSLDGLPLPGAVNGRLETLLSSDITHDATLNSKIQRETAPAVRSYLASPLISRSGETMGALLFGSGEVGVFGELHVKLAEGIAAQAAIALDNARLFAEAQATQETLRRSNFELRRANEDLNQFAYSASHDLQEPLRMVALYSQMMQRKYKPLLDVTAAEYLNYMAQGARRMEMLLRDLLSYTQVVAGTDDVSEQTDANLVFQSTIQNLAQAITESNAIVQGKDLPVLAVKEVHLLQLLQNLIGNALKYRGENQTQILVVAEELEDRFWKFSIRDNGIGIAPQYTRQVFGLFKRLHGSTKYEGTGIGLAICQKIVERYGGRIWAESEGEGKGSTFCFTLPGVN